MVGTILSNRQLPNQLCQSRISTTSPSPHLKSKEEEKKKEGVGEQDSVTRDVGKKNFFERLRYPIYDINLLT